MRPPPCLCNWLTHGHDNQPCTKEAYIYQWSDGKSYQLCPMCVDMVEAERIVREAPLYAKDYYMGDS